MKRRRQTKTERELVAAIEAWMRRTMRAPGRVIVGPWGFAWTYNRNFPTDAATMTLSFDFQPRARRRAKR